MKFIRQNNNFFSNTLLLYVCCFILVFCRLSFNYRFIGDDFAYIDFAKERNLFDFLVFRYQTWTSRVFVEMFLYLFSIWPLIVWKLFISLSFVGWGIGFSYLIGAKTLLQKSTVFLSIVALPNIYWNNAGWLVTTVAYMFCVCLSMLVLCSIRDMFDKKPISLLKFIAYIVGTLIAANVEQCCFILGACFVGASLYLYLYHKRVAYVLLIQLVCVIFDILLFLMSEGNEFRFRYEIRIWWLDFYDLSYPMKFFLGFRHLFDIFFFDYYIVCLVFGLITVFFMGAYFIRHKKLCLWLWLSSCGFFLFTMFFRPENMEYFNQYIDLGWAYIAPLALLVYLMIALFNLFGHNFQFYLYMAILWLGIATLIMLGLSPTLYASHVRVFLCFVYVLLFLLLWCYIQYGNGIPYFTAGIWMFNVFWLLQSFWTGYFIN